MNPTQSTRPFPPILKRAGYETSDLLGQFTEEKEDGEILKFSYWTFTVLLGVLLRCYKARVTSVEYNKVLMFSHSRSLEAFFFLKSSFANLLTSLPPQPKVPLLLP